MAINSSFEFLKISTVFLGLGGAAILATSAANASIDGSGVPLSIDGSGVPLSIDGSGVPLSIDGSGVPLSIDGSGVPLSIDGSGVPTLAIGPAVRIAESTYSVMGYKFDVPVSQRLTSAPLEEGDYLALSLSSASNSSGFLKGKLSRINHRYVPGVSAVLIFGRVQRFSEVTGEISVNNISVDMNNLLRQMGTKPKVGGFVLIFGTHPQAGEKILARSIRSF